MSQNIEYREGGNPPIAPGLFMVKTTGKRRHAANLVRLAWWPAGIPATDANISNVVVELVWKRETDEPVSREQIVALINGGRHGR